MTRDLVALAPWSLVARWPLVELPADTASLARLLEPADPATIEGWVLALATVGLRETPAEETLSARLIWITRVCGKLPALCWTEETLDIAAYALKFWPTPKVLEEFLRPIADDFWRKLHPEPKPEAAPSVIQARESPIPYQLPAPPPARAPRHTARRYDDDLKAAPIIIDPRVVAAQLAALGVPDPRAVKPKLTQPEDTHGQPRTDPQPDRRVPEMHGGPRAGRADRRVRA
jgi:hypothetical protein